MASRQLHGRRPVASPGMMLLVLLAAGAVVAPHAAADQRAESSEFRRGAPPTTAAVGAHSASSSSQQPAAAAKQQRVDMRVLQRHPAVFTLHDLGIWSTELVGKVPLAAAAAAAVDIVRRHPVPAAARKVASAVSASLQSVAVPHPGSSTVLLRHWWRLRCSDDTASAPADGSMDLRGLGTATSASDWVFHHSLTSYVPGSAAALNLTDAASGRSWTLAQSDVVPGIPAGWHVEAPGLSASAVYGLAAAQPGVMSGHRHSLDASRCSEPPRVFAPGSMWSVITASEPYKDMDQYARLVAEHTSYHQALGLTGAILFVTRPIAARLLVHPALQTGVAAGSYVFILWDGDVVPGVPYYHQSLLHNLVLLATWGVPDVRLAFIDLDEFYVLPRHASFQEAFADGGCMAGLAQARVMRLSAYHGISAAQAAACPDSTARRHSPGCVEQAQQLRSRRPGGDVAALTSLGWRRFFSAGPQYIDARYTIPESKRLPHRWAHKSFVDPNHVAAYSIHEAGVLLPGGGGDSQAGLPLTCAFGLHYVNMMSHRMTGEGDALALEGGAPWDMAAYAARLFGRQAQQQQQQHRQQQRRSSSSSSAAMAEL